MYRQAICAIVIVVMSFALFGCGSSGGGTPSDPGGPGGAVVSLGQVQVEVASAAGFKTTQLNTPQHMPYVFTVFWGSEIIRMQEVGSAGKIAYHQNPTPTDIWTMNPDGSGQTRLTTHLDNDTNPTWSPDGLQIAFGGRTDGDDDIFVMNADGSGRTKITGNVVGDQDAAWSPDGTKIALARLKGGDWEIYVMNADGSGSKALTDNSVDDGAPAWSPDGRRIVYHHHDGTDHELYTMAADGTGQAPITATAENEYDPAWSPDGSRIAFTRFTGGDHEIFTVRPDGSGEVQVTDNSVADTTATWSPDGTQIAYTSYVGGTYDIHVIGASGGAATNLTNTGDHHEWSPDWSRSPTLNRGFIGSVGTDGGSNPPFGLGRPLALVGIGPTGLNTRAITVTISEGHWPSIDAKALNNTGVQLIGMKLTATNIKSFLEDVGRGIPARKWDLRGTPSTSAAIVYIDGTTGQIRSIIGTADTALETVSEATDGTITLTGSFTEAYDFRNPTADLLVAPVREIAIDAASGEVMAAN